MRHKGRDFALNFVRNSAVTILVGVLAIAGCAQFTTVRQDGSVVKHYIGYVRVIEPPTVGKGEPFYVSEIETLGLRLSKGVGLGYFHERSEAIPLDCRLVINVANEQQLERVFQVLFQSKIMEEGLCATVSP